MDGRFVEVRDRATLTPDAARLFYHPVPLRRCLYRDSMHPRKAYRIEHVDLNRQARTSPAVLSGSGATWRRPPSKR